MNFVEISCNNEKEECPESQLIEFIGKVLHYLNIDRWELSLVVCNDSFIRELNSRYRRKDEATDVLSFTQSLEDTGEKIYAGDIVVSLDSVKKNAVQFGVSVDEEFKRVIIHGILHLSGMDHTTNKAREPMLVKQEQILHSLKGEVLF